MFLQLMFFLEIALLNNESIKNCAAALTINFIKLPFSNLKSEEKHISKRTDKSQQIHSRQVYPPLECHHHRRPPPGGIVLPQVAPVDMAKRILPPFSQEHLLPLEPAPFLSLSRNNSFPPLLFFTILAAAA